MRGGTVITIVLLHTLIKLGGDTNTNTNTNTNKNTNQVTDLSATFVTSRTTTQANVSTPSRPASLNRIGLYHLINYDNDNDDNNDDEVNNELDHKDVDNDERP